MTYLVLARKWRPRSFDTLVGQDHVVRALTHALSTQRLHHAWLFTGTRGVGKTTLSRILAKALNCETGITPNPCGQCQACTEIDAGRFVDYVELDAASNRGVDEMTQLLEQAVYAPSSGRYKVYMIDEVHMLTGHAFNAMLKTLEEPPAHVKFILATTDPQKIPVTVLSRCLQFNLKQMTVPAIVEHLDGILQQEGIPFELPGLRLLAQAAAGSMRDALSLTDQAIAYSAGSLSTEAVQGMLGTIDQGHLVRLLNALGQRDASVVLQVADDLASRGLSYSAALADLAVLLSQIAIEQRLPGSTPAENPLQTDIQNLAQNLGPDFIQLFYSVAVHSRNELSLAPDEYAGFVMACLRMLALMPDDANPQAVPPTVISPPTASQPEPSTPSQTTAAAQTGSEVQATAPQAEPPVQQQQSQQAQSPSQPPVQQAAPQDAPAVQPKQVSAPAATESDVLPQVESATAIPAADKPASPVSGGESSAEPLPPVVMVGGTALQKNAETSPANGAAAPHYDETPAWEDLPVADESGSAQAAPAFAEHEPPEDFDQVPFDDQIHGGDDDDSLPAEQAGAAANFSADEVSALLGAAKDDSPAKRVSLRRMQAKDWPAVAASLALSGWAAELARQSEWVGVEDQCVTLRVAIRSADDSQAKTRLTTVLAEYFGEVLRVQIEYGDTGSDTAHAVEQAEREQRQLRAEADAKVDPLVVALINTFDATLLPGSVRANHHQAASLQTN